MKQATQLPIPFDCDMQPTVPATHAEPSQAAAPAGVIDRAEISALRAIGRAASRAAASEALQAAACVAVCLAMMFVAAIIQG